MFKISKVLAAGVAFAALHMAVLAGGGLALSAFELPVEGQLAMQESAEYFALIGTDDFPLMQKDAVLKQISAADFYYLVQGDSRPLSDKG